jgi:hypothetical protein
MYGAVKARRTSTIACAVAIRLPVANIYEDAVFNFVVGGETRCGF